MFGIIIIVIIILVISFIVAFVVSSKDYENNPTNLADHPSVLFEDEVKNNKEYKPLDISDDEEIEIDNDQTQNDKDELFDDELI